MEKIELIFFTFLLILLSYSTIAEESEEQIILVIEEPVLEAPIKNITNFISIVAENFTILIGESNKTNLENIQKEVNLISIEEDLDLELFEYPLHNQENTSEMWNLKLINILESPFTGKDVKIGVLDSGIEANEYLQERIVGGVSFINGSNFDEDEVGHGTVVSSILASSKQGEFRGIAPEVDLYSIKIVGSNGGKLSYLLQGISWAIDNKLDILITSLGIPVDSPSLRQIVDTAYAKGILIISASGKEGEIYYPARYSSTIAVGAIDKELKRIPESGVGAELELVAPGKNILALNPQGELNLYEGTSVAAPHVAGIAALLKEEYNIKDHNELRSILQTSTLDLGELGRDVEFGFGLSKIVKASRNQTYFQVYIPEEEDSIKKEELKVNPIEITIINKELNIIINNLLYMGSELNVNVSVEPGKYEIIQDFGNNEISQSYEINEGEGILILLYKQKIDDPQFIIDTPSIIRPGESLPVLVIVKDADQDDACIDNIIIEVNNGQFVHVYDMANTLNEEDNTYETDEHLTKEFWYHTFMIPNSNLIDGYNQIDIEIERVSRLVGGCFGEGINPSLDTLFVRKESKQLPKFTNWYCGDTHYHSRYTNTDFFSTDKGELGGPIKMTSKSVEAMSLDWFIVTDHSNSLDNPNNVWSTLVSDCSNYANCLIGEEINCDYKSTVEVGKHVLGYDLNQVVEDNFDDQELPTPDNPSCSQIINQVNSQLNGFTYVAHPASKFDAFGFGINTVWDDYSLPFIGLEVWNGDIKDLEESLWDDNLIPDGQERLQDLEDGLVEWKKLLLNGRKIFIAAGTDAHGDFNEAFGKEYTCCYAPYYSKNNIFDSLENGKCYMGNNGALKLEISSFGKTAGLGGNMTVCNGESATFKMDYNLINNCTMRLYEGVIGNLDESPPIATYSISGSGNKQFSTTWDPGDSYYRLECNNSNNDRIYTNPIWINVETTDSDSDGHTNSCDICPNLAPVWEDDSDDDDDGLLDSQDPDDCDIDYDDDSVIDGDDNCISDTNPDQLDNDNDGLGDVCDDDDDNDGILDVDDQCPNEPGPAYNNGCLDTVPPTIATTSPINNSVYNTSNVTVNLTTDELVRWYINWHSNEGNYSMDDTNWVSFVIEDLEEGDHTLLVKTVDYSNNTANMTINFEVDLPDKPYSHIFNLPLASGWNLVSTPLILVNSSIHNIINNKIEKIFYFNGTDWLTWIKNIGGNTLSSLEPLKGYWVYTTEATNFTLYGNITEGTPPRGYGLQHPRLLEANKWYIVGYYSTNYIDDINTDDALASLCGSMSGMSCSSGDMNFGSLIWYDTDNLLLNSTAQSTWDSDVLWDRGRGFWIHMTAADTLTGTP